MAVYVKKVNGKQRRWLLNYEKTTSFEPLYQEELDNGQMTFSEVARANIEWFEDWSKDALGIISNPPIAR